MSTKGKVLLAWELWQREELAFKLLSTALQERGYNVKLCSLKELRRKVNELKPDVVISNFFKLYHAYFYFAWEKFRIVDIMWEQIVDWYSWKIFKPEEKNQMVSDAKICWGELFKNLMEFFGFPKDKLFVTGSPKHAPITIIDKLFDKAELRKTLGLNSSKRVILICTAFPLAFAPKPYLDNLKKRYGLSFVETTYEFAKFFHGRYLEFVDRIANKYPKFIFILRPHPSKFPRYVDSYLKLSSDNVIVDNSGDISWWVNTCDILISNGSTTSMDAYIAEIPTISIKLPLWLEITLPRRDVENFGVEMEEKEIISNLPDIIREGHRREVWKDEFIKMRINVKDKPVFNNISNVIDTLMNMQPIAKPRNFIQEVLWFYRKEIREKLRLRYMLKSMLKTNVVFQTQSENFQQKIKELTDELMKRTRKVIDEI